MTKEIILIHLGISHSIIQWNSYNADYIDRIF